MRSQIFAYHQNSFIKISFHFSYSLKFACSVAEPYCINFLPDAKVVTFIHKFE